MFAAVVVAVGMLLAVGREVGERAVVAENVPNVQFVLGRNFASLERYFAKKQEVTLFMPIDNINTRRSRSRWRPGLQLSCPPLPAVGGLVLHVSCLLSLCAAQVATIRRG